MTDYPARRLSRKLRRHLKDTTAASAALLHNRLPELMLLPSSELYEVLRLHLEATVSAYLDLMPPAGVPTPSTN